MASALLLSAGSDYNGDNSLFILEEKPITSYTSRTIQVPFQANQLKFGDLAYATLPRRDDIVKSITLRSTLGSLYPITANGYVFSTTVSDTKFYDYSGSLKLQANDIYGYFNTQLLNNWAQTSNSNVNVVGDSFNFQGINGAQFTTEEAASFWGFDIRYADTSNPWKFSTSVPQMTLIESGWVLGFLQPPKNFTYYDSVGYLLPRISTLYIGGQTIQTINSQTLYTETDLEVPLENQAALTILVGKNDSASQTVSRNYWTTLTFDQIPISQLGLQDVQVAVQFENIENLTDRSFGGGILNGSAYTFYTEIPSQQSIARIFTYKGLIIISSQFFYTGYTSIYNELNGELIQQIVVQNYQIGFCINQDIYYSTDNSGKMLTYDLSINGISNPRTSTIDTRSGYGGLAYHLMSIGKYIFMLYDKKPVAYDTTLSINSLSAYTFSPITIQSYCTSLGLGTITGFLSYTAVTTGKYIYYIIYTSTELFYIFYISINLFLAGSTNAFNVIPLPPNFNGQNVSYTFRNNITPPSDGIYIYYDFAYYEDPDRPGFSKQLMYRMNTSTNTLEMYPAIVGTDTEFPESKLFDGKYIYYFALDSNNYSIYRYYDTSMSFTDTNAWSFIKIYPDGSTISSNGTSSKAYITNGFDSMMCLGSLYIYNFINSLMKAHLRRFLDLKNLRR
jgi:hypothetical protein